MQLPDLLFFNATDKPGSALRFLGGKPKDRIKKEVRISALVAKSS